LAWLSDPLITTPGPLRGLSKVLIEIANEMGSFMSELARIVRFHELGGPDVLRIEELPIPAPGAGEVRLRVKAIGLSRAEVFFRQDQYLYKPHLPSKLGYEASGIVEALGAGVDPSLLGKTMSTVPCFPANEYGVYGEVAIVPARSLSAYPTDLSFEEGASIWMTYITAYGALVHYGQVSKKDYVLITAAASSVGVAAIDIVKAEGGVVIATVRSTKKKADLLALGADHVIVTDDEDVVARVEEITDGAGARLIFDAIAGPGIEALASAASDGATIFVYGRLAPAPTPFPIFAAIKKSLKIQGYTLFEITFDQKLLSQATQYVFDKLQRGAFRPRIDRSFPLAEIVAAHRYMESNEQVGKIVVTI
jgi:NADPH:quinone reductase-like Zn-dependent oxidoreductase